MPTTDSAKRAPLEDVRAAFEKLHVKDKAAFVVEAAFGTLGEAIEETGRGLSDLFEGLAEEAAFAFGFEQAEADDPDASAAPGV